MSPTRDAPDSTRQRLQWARATARRVRGALRGRSSDPGVVDSLDEVVVRDVERCRPYTMTSPERLIANTDAVDYIVRRGVPGAIVECGVWRGGSMLAMVLALQRLGVDDRDLWLYDTFEGMPEPGEDDVSPFMGAARDEWAKAAAAGKRAWHDWFAPERFGEDEVRALLAETGYPAERIHLVVGSVMDTIPPEAPATIAVLRLDTDWYESTKHEMDHLYPRVASGGVLIVDDYGHWEGSAKAVDEALTEQGETLLLHRTDYSGRIGVRPG